MRGAGAHGLTGAMVAWRKASQAAFQNGWRRDSSSPISSWGVVDVDGSWRRKSRFSWWGWFLVGWSFSSRWPYTNAMWVVLIGQTELHKKTKQNMKLGERGQRFERCGRKKMGNEYNWKLCVHVWNPQQINLKYYTKKFLKRWKKRI